MKPSVLGLDSGMVDRILLHQTRLNGAIRKALATFNSLGKEYRGRDGCCQPPPRTDPVFEGLTSYGSSVRSNDRIACAVATLFVISRDALIDCVVGRCPAHRRNSAILPFGRPPSSSSSAVALPLFSPESKVLRSYLTSHRRACQPCLGRGC